MTLVKFYENVVVDIESGNAFRIEFGDAGTEVVMYPLDNKVTCKVQAREFWAWLNNATVKFQGENQ